MHAAQPFGPEVRAPGGRGKRGGVPKRELTCAYYCDCLQSEACVLLSDCKMVCVSICQSGHSFGSKWLKAYSSCIKHKREKNERLILDLYADFT